MSSHLAKNLLFVALVLLTSNQVFAALEIFKCLDKYGRPTYSHSKIECENPEIMSISAKKIKDKASSQAKKTKNELEVSNRKTQCIKYRQLLKAYTKSPFLTKSVVKNGKSTKIRLSNEEKEKELLDAQSNVDYWCKDKSN